MTLVIERSRPLGFGGCDGVCPFPHWFEGEVLQLKLHDREVLQIYKVHFRNVKLCVLL